MEKRLVFVILVNREIEVKSLICNNRDYWLIVIKGYRDIVRYFTLD